VVYDRTMLFGSGVLVRGVRTLALSAVVALAPVLKAHHSFTAEFDMHRVVILHGTVTRFEMTNPHGWITLNVKNDNGETMEWQIELSSPDFLEKSGWKRDLVKVGDFLTIEALRAKDGTRTAAANVITLADGRKMRGGAPVAPEEELPPPRDASGSSK
jgi:Family of unknown function (DUF6152)